MSEEITEIAEETAISAAEGETAAPKKKKGKKGKIILAVVLVAIVGLGAGFWVWHEQPSFCNAICHTPMDPVSATYEQELGVAGIDKWGNEVTNTASMLSVTHKEQGATCMSCHVPTLSEQISEGIAWISGNYSLVANATYGGVLAEKDLKDLTAARGVAADEFCMNSDCHEGVSRGADLIALTADLSSTRNPHTMPHGDLQCSDCHKAHRASVNTCSSCHSDAPIPEGWLTSAEEKKLEQTA